MEETTEEGPKLCSLEEKEQLAGGCSRSSDFLSVESLLRAPSIRLVEEGLAVLGCVVEASAFAEVSGGVQVVGTQTSASVMPVGATKPMSPPLPVLARL